MDWAGPLVVASPAAQRWLGPALAVAATFGFSIKAILIKLAYAWHPIDAETLLALRMLYAAPLFMIMAWWAGRGAAPIARGDVPRLILLGFVGYYLASLLDFMGLKYITAALERLVLFLFPTMVVLLSAVLYRKPVGRRTLIALVLSYAGIVLVFWHDLRVSGDASAIAIGGSLVFASALFYSIYLVGAGELIRRLGSMRFIAWVMLASTLFVLAHFAITQPLSELDVPPRIHLNVLALATFSTVLPTWMTAEAIRRIGANSTSLVGSLGPIFTIALGAVVLGEATHALQIAGAALVLAGVFLVTRK